VIGAAILAGVIGMLYGYFTANRGSSGYSVYPVDQRYAPILASTWMGALIGMAVGALIVVFLQSRS